MVIPETPDPMSKICFVCPDLPSPAGGIKQIFRQVHTLNNHGYEAYIVHGNKYFNITWFEHQTPSLYDPDLQVLIETDTGLKGRIKKQLKKWEGSRNEPHPRLKLEPNDIVVLPEFYGKYLNDLYPEARTVIYNQNCYYTFRGYGLPGSEESENTIYKQDRLEAVIVASEDAVNYMESVVKGKPVHRVFYGMDDQVFSFQDRKQKKIAFMPRKLNVDAVQVLNMLDLRGSLDGWEIVPIKNMNEKEVAAALQECAIFMSFNHREGFGMPPAEAMNCGCIVVGYAGQGGNEYMLPDFSFKVEQRNIRDFALKMETALQLVEQEPDKAAEMRLKASQFIQSRYSMKHEEDSIMAVWHQILS